MGEFFKHPHALVESSSIGEGTRIWAFAHILPGAQVGRDCNLCDHIFVENDVVIGDRVTVKCGVQLWDGVHIEDDVFIGPNATFTNDPFPRSKQYVAAEDLGRTVVKRGASIGANATILPGLVIGEMALVGAGAVVTRNVPPHAVVAGNPAGIIAYRDTLMVPETKESAPPKVSSAETEIKGVTYHHFPEVDDMRGALTFAETYKEIPFEVKRIFLVYAVPSREIRGEHAHRTLHQFLICVHGSCSVIADDGKARREFRLDAPSRGLYLPPLVWGIQYKHSEDCVLLVLASAPYDASDYIREYSEFKDLVAKE
jgi:acetyltransferase-like isoleucine patch superfamily enzyme/dTDP-4-dehydrorhamnose 3,5-epimerase-like enzyme